MSLFPPAYFAPGASLTPFFRFLNDFDNYSREVTGSLEGSDRRTAVFSPRFDLRETQNTYELHGELPGIERENVQIEFTEPQTMVISGRTERKYASGTPPAGLVEDGEARGAITEGGETAMTTKKNEGSTELATTKEKPANTYWVSERSVGEFSRTFSFPSSVDQDGVAARLKDGILNVTVPKVKKPEPRKIAVR